MSWQAFPRYEPSGIHLSYALRSPFFIHVVVSRSPGVSQVDLRKSKKEIVDLLAEVL